MSQVFNNLLINARQAMPHGGSVTVTASNIEVHGGDPVPVAPGRYVRITVADEGSGIAPEHVSRIFDPYFTTKELGSGLGLASLHSIIKRHGGAVTVSSLPGAGTTFTLFLPAATEPATHEHDVQKEVSPPQGAGKILVMDDEEIIRELAVALLEDLGYSAEVCPDGSQAVALHAASRDGGTPYAAIILDLTVPGGMGGREAAVRIRAVDPDVPLIVSSGYSSDTQISECLALGFNGAVRKPYTLQEITAELSRVIGEAKRG
jgi:CheY-like chemotaxis protein